MDELTAEIIKEIHEAFETVSNEGGTTLAEAMALDNRVSEADLKAAREEASFKNWQDIPRDNLEERFDAALSHMNAEGFRFHIPAYMIATLEAQEDENSLSLDLTAFHHLTQARGTSLRKSTPEMIVHQYGFNRQQCKAIARFLRWVVDYFEIFGSAEVEAVRRWEKYVL